MAMDLRTVTGARVTFREESTSHTASRGLILCPQMQLDIS